MTGKDFYTSDDEAKIQLVLESERIEEELFRVEAEKRVLEVCFDTKGNVDLPADPVDADLEIERRLNPDKLILDAHLQQPYAVWDGEGPINSVVAPLQALNGIEAVASEVMKECTPENTRLAYRGDLRYFGAWLIASGFDFKSPPTKDIVLRFILEHLGRHYDKTSEQVERRLIKEGYKSRPGPHSFNTVKRRLASLSVFCDAREWSNPVKTPDVRTLMNQLSKNTPAATSPTAITRNMVLHLLGQAGDDSVGVRDRALIGFLFGSGGRRRSEAEGACVEHLEKKGDDYIFFLQSSKTSKGKAPEPKPITGMAAKFLSQWLIEMGSPKEGPLFRSIDKGGRIKDHPLKGAFINRIVKKLCERAGYDPKEFSSHSLRSGFVSQAAYEGCSILDIKNLTGHKSDSMVSRYFQQGDVLRSKAGRLL